MPERKIWNEKEDKILRLLKEVRGLKKWSEIAKTMDEEFGVKQRTGKQCRERYHNHLDSSINTEEWSQQEEQLLYHLHEEVGNKWSVIAQKLPGRSDNCVKNHFYSKLRKETRRLNRVIQEKYRRECRQIKIPLLNKIIEATQQRFKNSSKFEDQTITLCINIKNKLFKLDQLILDDIQREQQTIKSLIDQIMSFELTLKKTIKQLKEHKASIQTICPTKKQSIAENQDKKQVGDEPFYQIFKRVCEEIMFDQV